MLDGLGRTDVDLNGPISSCAVVGTCFMASLSSTQAGPTQSRRGVPRIKAPKDIRDEFLPQLSASFRKLSNNRKIN